MNKLYLKLAWSNLKKQQTVLSAICDRRNVVSHDVLYDVCDPGE